MSPFRPFAPARESLNGRAGDLFGLDECFLLRLAKTLATPSFVNSE
jgi:hypothetical protein